MDSVTTSPEPVPITVEEWVTKASATHKFDLQNRIVRFLLSSFGVLLSAAILIYLLQGFAVWGFKLSETDLKFIGTATIGGVIGLLTRRSERSFVSAGQACATKRPMRNRASSRRNSFKLCSGPSEIGGSPPERNTLTVMRS